MTFENDLARALSSLAIACSLSCSVYEPPEEGEHHGEGERIELGEQCTGDDIPVASSGEEHYLGSLDDRRDDLSSFPGCAYQQRLPGPDGFLRIDAAAGDRWHVEVAPEDEALDLAVYLMPTCDALACQLLIDHCGQGLPEDFTFVAESAGEYLLGIDSTGEGGDFELLTLRTRCGDGVAEHGESCDDGNLESGDGCDSKCRIELDGPSASESEPNNWHTSANVLGANSPSGSVRVSGTLGGPCDTDHYAVHVPEGASIAAVMKNGAGLECDFDHAPVSMWLGDPSTGNRRGFGSSGGEGGGCPSIELGDEFNEGLPAGEYHLIAKAERGADLFDYVFEIAVVPKQGKE